MLSHGGSGGKPPARAAPLPSARPCAPFALTLTCSGRAARPCGLASDAPPLPGGGARSGSARRLPVGRLRSRCARAAGPRRTAPVTSPCRRMPGCRRGSARRRSKAPPGRFPARRAFAATAIPFALLRVCQDRLCTYKVTWAAPPSGAGRAIALAIARVPHAIQSHAGTLRRLGSTYRLGGTPMDANTINATCNVLLVVIGIIGLVLVRKE